MKLLMTIAACALAIPAFAAETNAAPSQSPSTSNAAKPVVTLAPSSASVTAPLTFTNGVISQPETTGVEDGGKAIYNFTLTNAGTYEIRAVVNAPDESANSFYVNVDAAPTDPEMIWDIETADGFLERTVSWRGSGGADSDEFVPKRFKLSAGDHKLFIFGREPSQLKTVSIYQIEKQ